MARQTMEEVQSEVVRLGHQNTLYMLAMSAMLNRREKPDYVARRISLGDGMWHHMMFYRLSAAHGGFVVMVDRSAKQRPVVSVQYLDELLEHFGRLGSGASPIVAAILAEVKRAAAKRDNLLR